MMAKFNLFLFILQVLLVIGKVYGIILQPWWLILIPLYIYAVQWIFGIVILILSLYLITKNK